MRICLVSQNRFHNDRKAVVAHRVLVDAGHDVSIVAIDDAPPREPVTFTVSRRVGTDDRFGALLRRLLPDSVQDRVFEKHLALACAETGADIFIPMHVQTLAAAATAAARVGAMVQRSPGMADTGPVDLITMAPRHPELALPKAGIGTAHTPQDVRAPYRPESGRLRGQSAVLCFRKTESNPGRYIEEAMERSGLDVRLETESIDLASVDPNTAFVLFVEGPYPPIDVTGQTAVPILFWAHHGEHHLHANQRLTIHYQADAVLLAHSWHLAPWFPVPVHRFPFAVPVEHCESSLDLADRPYSVSMVGSKLRGDAWQYEHRRHIVEALESDLGAGGSRFIEGVAPTEMFQLYGQSKLVLNEGGSRHYPITMRVFEAIGSRAGLLTDVAPGLEMLFNRDQYALLGTDVVSDVRRLLDDLEGTQVMANAAHDRALGAHTYDHRVDELMEIATVTTKRPLFTSRATSELARLIDGDVEVQRLVHDGEPALGDELPTREVWPLSERGGRTAPASMDAAVITHGSALEAATMLDMARLYIYASEQVADLDGYLHKRHPGAVTHRYGRFSKVDLGAESYRAEKLGGPG